MRGCWLATGSILSGAVDVIIFTCVKFPRAAQEVSLLKDASIVGGSEVTTSSE